VLVEGADEATFDAVLTYNCDTEATLLVMDPSGRVIWYQDFAPPLPEDEDRRLTGFSLTDGGVLAAQGRRYLSEVGWDGAQRSLVDTDPFGGDQPLHHDVHAHGGLYYALYAYADGQLLLDGVYVTDAEGALLADLKLGEIFDPISVPSRQGDPYWTPYEAFRGLTSVTHANSVFADDRGELVISMNYLNTVIAVVGDPRSADFGALVWALEGRDSAAFEGTYTISADAEVTEDLSFEAQHCAEYGPSGGFTLFDNRHYFESRAMVMDLDADAGVAQVRVAWELGVQCEHQSAIYELADGDALVTCAPRKWFAQYTPGVAAPVWRLDAQCSGEGGLHDMLTRGIPISL